MRRMNVDGSTWTPTANSRVCSEHFISGEPSRFPDHPDNVPSVFKHKPASRRDAVGRFERSINRRNTKPAIAQNSQTSRSNPSMVPAVAEDSSQCSNGSPGLEPEAACQLIHYDSGEHEHIQASEVPVHRTTPLESGASKHDECQPDQMSSLRIAELEALLAKAEERNLALQRDLKAAQQHTDAWRMSYYELKETTLSLSNLKTEKDMLYYTGLPSRQVFNNLLYLIVHQNQPLKKHEEIKTHNTEEQLFMVLVRLRTGMPTKEISRNFSIPMSTFRRLFSAWILMLEKLLTDVTGFPSLSHIQFNISHHFRRYPNTRIILDTTEIRIQKPSGVHAQRQTFSSYKHANTMKCLVGATPDCFVNFVSALYGGGTSDRKIVQQSGVLDLLEPGDGVMVDKGFKVEDLLPHGVSLYMPPFRIAGKAQMSAKDVEETRHIAIARVHIERVIRRINEFHILDKPFPINMLNLADAVFTTCAYLSNFRGPLINNEKEKVEDE
ncbi:uncharacterized protein LOC119381035 [Rhipicephalus sanguineus]|uniref:uncharacterized protein LOC119381035 n=1 Tax=Rhipicephalus sanguineus TaxID=34632 RepID=UPI0020C1E8A7|nr:uncharacterized protein LOC119381035 [Rhipicephalus sanguineus]